MEDQERNALAIRLADKLWNIREVGTDDLIQAASLLRAFAAAPTAPATAGEGEAAGEVVEETIDRKGWRKVLAVKWAGDTPPAGTKLYTAPPAAAARVDEGMILRAWDAWDAACRQDDSDGVECMRTALTAALKEPE